MNEKQPKKREKRCSKCGGEISKREIRLNGNACFLCSGDRRDKSISRDWEEEKIN